MQVFGVEFAPVCVPLRRRLQTLAAAAWFLTLAFGPFVCFIATYLLLVSRFWWLMLLYLLFVYLDRTTCEQGGRPQKFIQHLAWWRYLRDYFPLRLVLVPGAEFHHTKNYLFCCFPHGVLPTGVFNSFSTDSDEYHQLFPKHQPQTATLHQHFTIPFFRELSLSLGGISCSAKSLNYLLSQPEGGNIVCLLPGGAAESYNSRPGCYKILLKKRKGFVKLALKNGSPLVPVISFGETDLFDQADGPKLRNIQEFFRKFIGIAPLVLQGRGFFQYSFGLIPRRKEVTTVVGKPVEFEPVEHPTKQQIEELHARFTQEIKNLFEEHKYKYLKNPQDKCLEIE